MEEPLEEIFENFFDQAIFDYKAGTSHLKEHLPKITQHYMDFTDACFEGGSIAEKEKQLIALGISIYAQDEYCIIYHTKGALEHGASEEEIAETIGVSAALGGGAAFAQGVTLTMEAYQYFSQQAH